MFIYTEEGRQLLGLDLRFTFRSACSVYRVEGRPEIQNGKALCL